MTQSKENKSVAVIMMEQQAQVKELIEEFDEYLNEWEQSFLISIEGRLKRNIPLSEKQADKLTDIRKNVSERMD